MDYNRVTTEEPHFERTRKILQKHPEIRKLFGHQPWTFPVVLAVVGTQFFTTWAVADAPWWGVLLAAFVIGATCEHMLFVLIHEATHNLIFKKASWNKLAGIFCSSPGLFPSAIGFRNFHLLHHQYQGELGWDADLPGPGEAKWVGNSTLRKALWLAVHPIIYGVIRPMRVKRVSVLEPWAILNTIVSVGAGVAVFFAWGGASLAYMALSLFFSIGLHPFGGRWLQEHYLINGKEQETGSYYGPARLLALYVGHHNEHHDFMIVPWNRLPKVKAIAPEFYDNLHSYNSWTKLVLRFVFDKNLSLYSRTVRPDHNKKAQRLDSKGTQRVIDRAKEITAPQTPQ